MNTIDTTAPIKYRLIKNVSGKPIKEGGFILADEVEETGVTLTVPQPKPVINSARDAHSRGCDG